MGTEGRKQKIVIVTAVVLAVGLPTLLWIRTVENADHVVPVLDGLSGKTLHEVLASLGQPETKGTRREYKAKERADIASSYEPDPPEPEFDEFLVYRWHLRIGVVFLRDGVVVGTYTGLT